MAWIGSAADTLGVGESSQGMDAGPVGSGLGADALGRVFGPNYVDKYDLANRRARLGMPAFSRTALTFDRDIQAYIRDLTEQINMLDRKATQIPYSLHPSKVRDYGKFFGPPVQPTQQTFFDPREVGRQREDLNRAVLDADTARARSNYFNNEPDWTDWVSGITTTTEPDWTDWVSGITTDEQAGSTPQSANVDIDGGADPYMYTRRRSPDYAAYVDLYNDLVAAQPAGMSKSDWGRRHWERHGGREGRDFYGPGQINYPVGPDGMMKTKFITRPQPPMFNLATNPGMPPVPYPHRRLGKLLKNRRPKLAYENAWTGVRKDPYMTASEV